MLAALATNWSVLAICSSSTDEPVGSFDLCCNLKEQVFSSEWRYELDANGHPVRGFVAR